MTAGAPYAELQATTNHSFLRGASRPEELFAQAAALGLPALGVVDRNGLAGVVRAHRCAAETGVRLVVGCRLDLADGPPVLAYPTDRASYARLCRLLTLGKGRAGRPGACDLLWGDLEEHGEGLLAVLLPPGGPDAELSARLDRLRAAFGDRAHLALTLWRRPGDAVRLRALADAAREARIAAVATGDVLYHAPERRILQDVVTCIREGCSIDDAGFRRERSADRHLRPPEEMARLFRRHPEAVARTLEIVERCRFSLSELRYQYPDEVEDPALTPQKELERLVRDAAPSRYPDGVPGNVAAQLRHELRLIEEMDYAPYFLTVHAIVAYARGKGILCQGRGSAANSAVCYVLGVTSIDPVRSGLLFERFVSADRREPPDIDVDFEAERREEVIQWVYARYGRDRAALCATVMRFRARGAVRDVGKALGLPEDVTGALASQVWGWSEEGVQEEHAAELNLDPADRRLRLTLELARELIGFPRQLGTHPGGFVLTRDRLDELVPIAPAAMAGRQVVEMGWTAPDGIDVPGCGPSGSAAKEPSGVSITMIGLDTAKAVFQVHALNLGGKALSTHKLRRDQLVPFFEKLEACTVVMEACGAAHHWGRLLTGLGHDVKLIPSEAVRPFVKRGRKNDAADAAAICEAASRPNLKFVPVKSPEQQGTLALHSARSILVKQQTMLANAMRGLATEFGLMVPLGIHRIGQLMARIEEEAFPETGRQAMRGLHERFTALQESIDALEKLVVAHARSDGAARRLATVPGIGPITASLIAATVADIGVFESSRKFAAWLGLVPRQHSTGGKTRLGRITKAGNRDIRRLLVLGATSMIRRAQSWNSVVGAWTRSALERRPARLVSVALANKMARMVWALLAHDEIYHPQGRAAAAA